MDFSSVYNGPLLVQMLYTVIAAVVLYKLINTYRWYKAWRARYELIPGRQNMHWLLGNMHEHPGENEDGIAYNMFVMEQFPRLVRYWVGKWMCVIVLHHPDTVRSVLKGSVPKPTGVGSVYTMGIKWLGEGLLIANGNKWFRNRKLLTPSFHFNILQTYTPVFNNCVDTLLDKLSTFAKNGESFDTFTHVGLCSLDIISRCAFSYHTDCQIQGDQHPYVNAVHRLSTLWVQRSLAPFQMFDFVYFNLTRGGWEFKRHCRYVHSVAEEIIHKRRQEIEHGDATSVKDTESDVKNESKRKYKDFLDTLLTARDEEGTGMSDLEIRNEVDTFLFEGHDTTTSGITFTLFALAQHPDVQEKARQEIDEILGDRETDDIQWSDLAKMDYLTMCIKEALRHYCPVHFMQREATEDMDIDGYTIPAGTYLAINIYNHHHNKLVWGEDCMDYKPERFLPGNIQNMDPFAFIPFSAGARTEALGAYFMPFGRVEAERALKWSLDTENTGEMLYSFFACT